MLERYGLFHITLCSLNETVYVVLHTYILTVAVQAHVGIKLYMGCIIVTHRYGILLIV